jgi:hypothetical protein
VRLIEKIRLKFVIKDKIDFFDDDKESLELYFQLLQFGVTKEILFLFGRRTSLSNVIQSKSDEHLGWCDQEGDLLDARIDGFRILASFENRTRYFVYVNDTENIYSTGYYYLFIMKSTTGFYINGIPTRMNANFDFNFHNIGI